jgi:hypothetical protein
MANKLIEQGNFDKSLHFNIPDCDAFGNPIELPPGFRFLGKNSDDYDKIEKEDFHFDIYGGWVQGHSSFYNGEYYYIHQGGRWKAWARKNK